MILQSLSTVACMSLHHDLTIACRRRYFRHRAGDEEFVDEEAEVTDDSDDPDAKEVDYDDE